MTAPRKRLAHRIPLRLRHHWKPAGSLAVGLSVLLIFFGDVRVTPFVTSASTADGDEITDNVTGAVDLFDDSRTHSIQLEYSETDFTDMMEKFQDEGEKEYIKADLTVDGVYLNDVGIRLKGNSTLQSLRGGGMGGGGQGGPAGQDGGAQNGGQRQNTGAQNGEQQQNGGQQQAPQGGGTEAAGGGAGVAGGGGGGMTQFSLSASKPEELPWLISIDEYVEGRAYEGHRELSLRPGVDEALPLNEALSLSLMKKSGQTAEKFAFTAVKVNSRPVATRLMVENPSKDYVDAELGSTGVAYKARAGSSFDYVGDDPTDYEESFKQLNLKGSQDLSPVMKLLKWVNQASDAEFAENLDKYVDVESFSEYVATQNLLLNFDDMAGPGKNYVLWYDLGTKKFSVLGWDFNLTFSGTATTGPDDSTSMGGGGGRGGAMPGGTAQDGAAGAPSGMPSALPSGMPQAPGNGQQDDRQDADTAEAGGPGGGGGGGMGGNLLKERFLAADAFDDAYHAAYKKLYQEFYASGFALDALDSLAAQAERAGADTSGVSATAKSLSGTVTSRTEALAKNEVITG
ncbi:CotH kinase family protein [Streptomyces sp. Root1310]|uniref:CotH kinase family protein n=1 Tax=Streptomyces sp. Root1310 TaxID=1736452 RepID=UPI00070EF0A9|nr:CotH kinase family protein [Streptomyces sp. Root1310]KQX62224.1 spore coat protein CotH [Streptomyces sp. Root1310]